MVVEQTALCEKINETVQYCEELSRENSELRKKLQVDEDDILLLYGEESDFFENEVKGLLLRAINKESERILSARSKDILGKILDAQSDHKEIEEREHDVKTHMKGDTFAKKQSRSAVENIGFSIELQGNGEYRLCYFGDERYIITAPNTPGDCRAFINFASQLCNAAY